jgi:broad specificity phosphatase PhoE
MVITTTQRRVEKFPGPAVRDAILTLFPEPGPCDREAVSTVLFLRHGETEWNRDGRLQGRLESALTDDGIRQAIDAAATLPADFDAVIASDLERARRTAAPFAEHRGLDVRLDARLRERSWGAWEGRSHAEVEAEHPDWRRLRTRPPDFESDEMVWARVAPVVEELRGRQGRVLCVTHGGVIGVIVRRFGGDARHLGNVEGIWVELSADRTLVGERRSFERTRSAPR